MKNPNVHKKLLNRKIILGSVALLLCLATITITSFVPFIIQPENWQTKEFLTDQLIAAAIVILSVVASVFIGQASNASNELSKIAKARKQFEETKSKITDINGFRQWIKQVLQPNDVKDIKIRFVHELGLSDPSILTLSDTQINNLIDSAQKYDETYYSSITKQQAAALIKFKNKGISFKFVEPEYYLSVDTLRDTRTVSERASTENSKKASYLTFSVVYKVLMTVIIAMIFASLGRDMTAETTDTFTAVFKFITRVWAMITSIFMGYMVGCQINDIDAEYVKLRIDVHNRYLSDKTFIPKSQQELAKQEYIEKVKKDNVLSIEMKS